MLALNGQARESKNVAKSPRIPRMTRSYSEDFPTLTLFMSSYTLWLRCWLGVVARPNLHHQRYHVHQGHQSQWKNAAISHHHYFSWFKTSTISWNCEFFRFHTSSKRAQSECAAKKHHCQRIVLTEEIDFADQGLNQNDSSPLTCFLGQRSSEICWMTRLLQNIGITNYGDSSGWSLKLSIHTFSDIAPIVCELKSTDHKYVDDTSHVYSYHNLTQQLESGTQLEYVSTGISRIYPTTVE